MADVFLSYASEDRAQVAPIARALGEAGYSVWWDRDIRPGADFAETIEREIGAAKAVVVCWSEHSHASKWVRDEAAFARDEGRLVPIQLGGAAPPMGFRQIQAIDFRDWRGDPLAPALAALKSALAELLAHAGAAPPIAAAKPSVAVHARSLLARNRPAFLAIGGVVAGAAAVAAFLATPKEAAIAIGEVELRPFTGPDAERSALAKGYAESFRQRLVDLGVRTVAPSAKGRSEMILAGEVASEGGKNVLSVHLDDRKTGATLWTLRAPPTEGAAWEANVAGFALNCALKHRDPARGPDYFARFLKACAYAIQGDWIAEQREARALYEAAPDDARAVGYYARSVASNWASATSVAEAERGARESRALAEQALKLDPNNADALFALALATDEFEFAKVERQVRAALDADPELSWGYGRYAQLLLHVGRIDEAIDYQARAMLYRRIARVTYPELLASTGNTRAAEAAFDLMRPYDLNRVGRMEMETLARYGDPEEAARRLATYQSEGTGNVPCLQLVVAIRLRETVDAADVTEKCGGNGVWSARIFALAGDLDAAYAEIESDLKRPGRISPPQLFWPEMRAMRRDPRFWPLAKRVGLIDYWLETDRWPDFCSEPDLPFDCKAKAQTANG